MEKFSAAPEVVLIGTSTVLDEDTVGLLVERLSYIPANTFYVGVLDAK